MNGTITSSGEADFPSVRGAHYLLFTLTGACLLSFVDRFTLNVLLGSIKGSMHLSDAQIGLLVRQMHRSEEHTSELQSLMRISYAVFCLTKKKKTATKQLHAI